MDRTEEAREYLRALKNRRPEFCRQTGLKYDWVNKFTQGHIANPSARLVDSVLAHKEASTA